MLRFVVVTWGLVGGWTWWVFAPKDGVASLVGAILLGSATVVLAWVMVRRSSRLRAGHEYVNARLEYHSGMSSGRWKRARPARDDDGGSELTLGSGW
jgi:hypothetical protein